MPHSMEDSIKSFEKLQLAQPGPSLPDIAKEIENLERKIAKLNKAGKRKEIRKFMSVMHDFPAKTQNVHSLNDDPRTDEHERWWRQLAKNVILLARRHGVVDMFSDEFDNPFGPMGSGLDRAPLTNIRCANAYIQELRSPTFVSSGAPFVAFGNVMNYLWGNTPAADILRLSEMEGTGYDKPIDLLFAATGDIRNALATIAGLPTDYPKNVRIVINDREPLVALRAFTFLRFLEDYGEDAIDAVIQLWYSTAVTSEQWIQVAKVFHDTLLAVPEDPADTDKQVRPHFNYQVFGVAVHLMTSGITLEDILTTRDRVMFAPDRIDYRHRYMQSMTPGERICFDNFRHHGLLLPYGAYNAHHNVANKLLIHPALGWAMSDSSDPLQGWDLCEVRKSGRAHGVPLDDHYGCLFFHLRDLLTKVVHRMHSLDLSIDIYCDDVRGLSKRLGGRRFDRIDTSNIADKTYLGLSEVLNIFGPKMNAANPKSTLFTGFMNWSHSPPDTLMKKIVDEVVKDMASKADRSTMRMDPRARQQLTMTAMAKANSLATVRYDATKDFRKYLCDSQKSVKDAKVRMRAKNAVIPRRVLLERTAEWEPVV